MVEMKKQNKKFVIGGNKRYSSKEQEKKCFFCGNTCFFTDKWNFDEITPICMDCGLKNIKEKESEVLVHNRTIKQLSNYLGIEEWESNILTRQITEHLTGKTPLVIKKIPSTKK